MQDPNTTQRKHILFVHGRSTKPAEAEKERLVRLALLRGIERTDPASAEAIARGDVRLTLAYYGDVTNRVMRRSDPDAWHWLDAKDPAHGNTPCESASHYEDAMAEALARPTYAFDENCYRRWLDEVPDARFIDEIAGVASGVAAFFGWSEQLIRKAAPDMAAYLTRLTVASEIRTRLHEPLRRALSDRDDILLLSHSMGCIVAYDQLWRLSRLAEYRALRGHRVRLWLTLGNPLSEPGVRNNLIDVGERITTRYPRDIVEDWINVSAYDDFICHDRSIADDYREMRRRGYVARIVDREPIYGFWRGASGSNPHKLYAYLNHPRVGAEIAAWVRGERPPEKL